MSDYLAWFGPHPTESIDGIHWVPQADAPEDAQERMEFLAENYSLSDGYFVVDETWNTAHDLINEIWKAVCVTTYVGSRIERVVKLAQESKAVVAAFDATWEPEYDSPLAAFSSYNDFGENLVQYVIGSCDLESICKPRHSPSVGYG